MGKVTLNNLTPGMVLAEDAEANGNVLLASGTIIGDKHLKIFKQWGIDSIDIKGVSDSAIEKQKMSAVDPELIEQAKKTVMARFIHTNIRHPAMKILFKESVYRLIAQLKKEAR